MERSAVAWLLRDLCMDLGFCLPRHAEKQILDSPPGDPDAFIDAVFLAEGLDPYTDAGLRRRVRQRIARALGDPSGNTPTRRKQKQR